MFYTLRPSINIKRVYVLTVPLVKCIKTMWGMLSALSTRGVFNFTSLSSSRNGLFSFFSKSLENQKIFNFTSIASPAPSLIPNFQHVTKSTKRSFLEPHQIPSGQIRTVIKFSLKKGKRKSVRAVRERFFRLNWGIWIRTMAGRHKKLWKKSASQRNRLKHHVFCNGTQSLMLDKMVNKFWRKPKYYIEDPYEPYHKRENFFATRKKPWRPEGVDYE